jgi:carboxymethylenebutenolidase
MTKLEPRRHQAKTVHPEPRAARFTASDFAPEVLRLFDGYVHGLLDRRGFLEQAAKYVLAGSSATLLRDALSPRFAEAQQVPADDAL